MKKIAVIAFVGLLMCSFMLKSQHTAYYHDLYMDNLHNFAKTQDSLLEQIKQSDLSSRGDVKKIKYAISVVRLKLKNIDFWLRYLEPIAYKKINGPLPVEWENEVFEKYEKPYKRLGSGLTLAEQYLDVNEKNNDSLARLIMLSADALNTFLADSITNQLDTFDHFFLCNRLYLLNLAAIYTTGFECPDKAHIISELQAMMTGTRIIYSNYNKSFPEKVLTSNFLNLYDKAVDFVNSQPADYSAFDHFSFIKDYINPLFAINQRLIVRYGVISNSFIDYTLNNNCNSIFDKSLYMPQNSKGIYSLIDDTAVLTEIREVGKLLFYDPILSGNNMRSCASCHKSREFFTDTIAQTAPAFDSAHRLPRNTPTLVDVIYNHLLMLDGREYSLQNQGRDVITNPLEMGGNEQEIVTKVMSCKAYKNALTKFAKLTIEEKNVSLNHIVSAITYYYAGFSSYYAPFDESMNNGKPLGQDAIRGFNLFMGKAQCATCHYVPQFNGVPPPYIGSEFEVVGVPANKAYSKLSDDSGRFKINPAFETMRAFRTGTIRNTEYTKPYMHNGVFTTLDEVIEFYDVGGGSGKKMAINNQTLTTDSLHLTLSEKKDLLSFLHSMNEAVIFEPPPDKLPASSNKMLNGRKVGGVY